MGVYDESFPILVQIPIQYVGFYQTNTYQLESNVSIWDMVVRTLNFNTSENHGDSFQHLQLLPLAENN